MALKPLNVVDGLSVGETPIDVIDANGNVTANSLVVNSTSNLGPISNITITGGTAGQFITTDGTGNLSFSNDSAGNSAAPMPYFIPNGTSYIVNENFQGLFNQPIDIEGEFEVDGILIQVDGSSGGGGGGSPGGANTQIQYNDSGIFGGSANLAYNKSTGVLSVPNITVTGTTLVNGNIIPNANVVYSLGNNTHRFNDLYLSGTTITLGNSILSANSTSVVITNPSGGRFVLSGNANTSTSVLANGNSNITIANNSSIGITANGVSNVALITKDGVDVTGTLGVTDSITSLGNITALGNISGIDVTATGNLNVTGDVSAGNVSVTGSFEASGNLSGININTSGDLGVIGNGNIQTNLFVGNNAVVSTRLSVGNPNGSNITDLYSNGYASLYKLDVVSNIAGNNLTITANANIVGTASIGTLLTSAVNSLGNVTAANITSNGLITANNANLGNLAIANFFQGDGRYLSNITVAGGTSIVNGDSNVFVEPNANVVFNINGTNNVVTVTDTNTYFDTNIIANNSIIANVVESGNVSMTINPTSTWVAFDIGSGNVLEIHDDYVTVIGNTNLNGVVRANSNVFITGNANIATVNATTANITGNITAGNIDGGNTISANYLVGDGYLISNITIDAGSSIINGNSNVLVAANGNVTITSEGNANVVTVTGNSVIFDKQISVPLATIATANANVINANNFNLNSQLVANGDVTANGGTLFANALSITAGPGYYGSGSIDGNLSVGTNMFVTGYANIGQINVSSVQVHGSLSANNTLSANILTAGEQLNTSNLTVNANTILHKTDVIGNLTASNIDGGNTVTANYLVGDGYLISNLTVPAGSYLTAGTSNLYVDGSGDIRLSVDGTSNVVVVTSTGANITGNLSTTGNANVVNLGTETVLATGNLTANKITSNGNISGTNVVATGNVSVTGNLTSGNANLGNSVRANFFIGDGYLLSNLTIPTGTAIINGDSNVLVTANSNVNITVNGTPNVGQFTEGGFIVTGNIDATGYINGGTFANGSSNIAISNSGAIDISIDGTDSVLSILSTGVYANSNVYALKGLSVTGNSNVGNLGVSGIITTPGSLSAGSLTTSGDLSVAANANLATARITGSLTTIGNVNGGNLVTAGTANVGTLYVGAGGANINGYTKVTANLDITGNLNVTGNVNYSNVTDLIVQDPLIYIGEDNSGDMVDLGIVGSYSNGSYQHTGIVRNHDNGYWTFFDGVAAEPTTVIDWANATYPTVKLGNLETTGNITVTGNVSANYFSGNVIGNISGNISVGSNTQVLFNDSGVAAGNTGFTFNKITGAFAVSANGSFGNVIGGNLVSANYFSGVLTTAAQPNITSVGTLSSVTVSGNANVGNLGTSGLITATGNITGGNLTTGGQVVATGNVSGGNLTTGGQVVATGNVSGANLVTTGVLSVTGNANVGNIGGNIGIFTGNVTAENVTGGNLVTANYFSGVLTTAAQPNITSIGTLSSLTVTGNITGGNLIGPQANGNSNVNIPSANGNVTISAAGNANIVVVTGTGANISGTANITGNVAIGGIANITGNLNVTGKSNLGSNSDVIITGGTANYVLSTDGSGNLSWVAQSGGGSGSANIAVYDEGNLLTNTVSSFNFVGDGVVANTTGNAVTVTISSGGGGPAAITLDSYIGNGVQTAFNLSTTPASENYTFVNIDGVDQLKTSYSVTGSVLTFSSAPTNGASIEITTVSALSTAQPSFTTRNYTGNGVQTTFTVTSGVTATGILVTQNGILQVPTNDYTVSGTSLIFGSAPASGQAIQVRELGTVVPVNTATNARALGYSLVFGL